MALKIRLARGGAKKRPFYRIVVAEATSPRDGRFVERIGSYNPFLEHSNKDRILVDAERAKYWLSVGAQPTDRVVGFLANMGLVAKPERSVTPLKSAPKKKAQERVKAAESAAERAAQDSAKAAEAAAAAAAAPAPVVEEVVVAVEVEETVAAPVEAVAEEAPAEVVETVAEVAAEETPA
jgi:small subunit ribosomal protein S16